MTNSPISTIPGAGPDMFFEAPVASHEIDRDGVIRKVNRAECEMLGYQPEELIGRHVSEFAVPEQRVIVRDRIARKIAREQALGIVTREYRRSNGTYLWLEIHERLIADAEGVPVGIHSVLIDITVRRQREAETEREQQRMKFILRSLPRALVTADTLGKVDYVNPAAERLTGWSMQEGVGRTMEEICHIRDHAGEPVDLTSSLLSEPVFSDGARKFEIVDRAGDIHPITWLLFPIRNESEVIIGLVLGIEKK